MDDYYANSMRIVAEDAHALLLGQPLQVEDVASGEDQVVPPGAKVLFWRDNLGDEACWNAREAVEIHGGGVDAEDAEAATLALGIGADIGIAAASAVAAGAFVVRKGERHGLFSRCCFGI